MESAGGVEDICAFGAAYPLETPPFQPVLEIHKYTFWSLLFSPILDYMLKTCPDNSHDLELVTVQLQRSQHAALFQAWILKELSQSPAGLKQDFRGHVHSNKEAIS